MEDRWKIYSQRSICQDIGTNKDQSFQFMSQYSYHTRVQPTWVEIVQDQDEVW